MNLDYHILWVEDLDESYDTYSRRITRYVENKNFRCNIHRIKMQNEFNITEIDLNKFDILIVDYKLGDSEDGREIIKEVRNGKYLNDVLFYSGEGEAVLLKLIQEQALEGVFVSNRNNQVLVPKIEALIDKSIRRTIDPISIRGMLLDVTSDFDNIIKDIINKSWSLLNCDEKGELTTYARGLVEERRKSVNRLVEKYSDEKVMQVDKLLDEREFTAEKAVRLLNKIMQSKNPNINRVRQSCLSKLNINEDGGDFKLYSEYKKDILDYRNKLAHVKLEADVSGIVCIGEVNGEVHNCDETFCDMIRKNLLKFRVFFNCLYDEFSNNKRNDPPEENM